MGCWPGSPVGRRADGLVCWCGGLPRQSAVQKMGKHRRPVVFSIFCIYCGRLFQSERVLLAHQRSRHFCCKHADCRRRRERFLSLGALIAHYGVKHRASVLTAIPNSRPGYRDPYAEYAHTNGMLRVREADVRYQAKTLQGMHRNRQVIYREVRAHTP